MKIAKIVLFTGIAAIGVMFLLNGVIIQNPKPENCEIKEIFVSKIYEGGVKDIAFNNSDGGIFYINRGLEQGLTIEGMEEKVLNKKVTLHLAKTITRTTGHISQLAIGNKVIYTEFD